MLHRAARVLRVCGVVDWTAEHSEGGTHVGCAGVVPESQPAHTTNASANRARARACAVRVRLRVLLRGGVRVRVLTERVPAVAVLLLDTPTLAS